MNPDFLSFSVRDSSNLRVTFSCTSYLSIGEFLELQTSNSVAGGVAGGGVEMIESSSKDSKR